MSKYTLGGKIDNLFLETIELILKAGFISIDKKYLVVQNSSVKLDTIKFFLKTAWELKLLSNEKYQSIVLPLFEVGKMLGGWLKYLQKQTPPKGGE